jgi:hypothetical protein
MMERVEVVEALIKEMKSAKPAPVGESAAEESGTMAEKIEALASQLEEAKKVWSLSETKKHSHLRPLASLQSLQSRISRLTSMLSRHALSSSSRGRMEMSLRNNCPQVTLCRGSLSIKGDKTISPRRKLLKCLRQSSR